MPVNAATVLNAATVPGGDSMDETGVTYPPDSTTYKRPNVVISGTGSVPGVDDRVETLDMPPAGTEYGVINRPIHSPYPGTPVVSYAYGVIVPSNAVTTITSYTVPTGKTFYFLSFVGCGDADGIYTLSIYDIASSTYTGMLVARTSVANLTAQVGFPYAPFAATFGQIAYLRVQHYVAHTVDFYGSIIGYAL